MGLPRKRDGVGAAIGEFVCGDGTAKPVAGPLTHEFLCRQSWPDGTRRETGTLMIIAQDGMWKAWLNDKDSGLTCWVSSLSLPDLFGLIEDGLEEEGLPWRQVQNQKAKK